MELPLELEEAIRAAPDDREAYLVAGDWLQEAGALQGELVVEDDRDRMVALLPPALRGASPFTIEWRWGFVRGVLLASMKDADESRLLRELLASPIARFVQKLVVQNGGMRLADAICEGAEQELRALRCLRTLMLFAEPTTTPLQLDRLSAALPSLRRLVLRASRAAGKLELRGVLELAVDRMEDVREVIAGAELPALEMLQLGSAVDLSSLDGLAPDQWLDLERLPNLRVLTLAVAGPLDVDVWRAARIAPQLERLDVFDITPGMQTERTFVIDRRAAPERAALLVMVGEQRGELISVERPAHQLASRHRGRHAELQHLDDQWIVRRDSPEAYTFVNGHDVDACPLRSLDEIAIDEQVYRFLEGDIDALANQLRARYGL